MRIKLLRMLYTLTQARSVVNCIQTSCRDAASQIRRHAILQSVALPLLLTGIAIVHALVRARDLGKGWLVLMYFGLFVAAPLSAAISTLALVDTWFNLRDRWKVKAPSDD